MPDAMDYFCFVCISMYFHVLAIPHPPPNLFLVFALCARFTPKFVADIENFRVTIRHSYQAVLSVNFFFARHTHDTEIPFCVSFQIQLTVELATSWKDTWLT